MNASLNTNNLVSLLNRSFGQQSSSSSLTSKQQQQEQIQSDLMRRQADKSLSFIQIFEIGFLAILLLEHTLVFILTLRPTSQQKNKFPSLITNNNKQRSNSLVYRCLHLNWIRAIAFSNMCLSVVFFISLLLKHYHPNLVHYSSITFYSLILTLVQQILINFNTFHLFIVGISVMQHFIRHCRLVSNSLTINWTSNKRFLLTEHTNVALILTASLALIFGYNFIFYTPKHAQTTSLLPLVTFNTILLPILNFINILFVLSCLIVDIYRRRTSLLHHDDDIPFDQQQPLSELRSNIEKQTCLKCYLHLIQDNPNLAQESDPYSSLHARFFYKHRNNRTSSARPSLTPPHDGKYVSSSYEHLPMMSEIQPHIRASYPSQPYRSLSIDTNSIQNKRNRSQTTDYTVTTRSESTTAQSGCFLLSTSTSDSRRDDLALQIINSNQFDLEQLSCHLCYRLLLIFILKYALLTLPQHLIQMLFHLRQFSELILKRNTLITSHFSSFDRYERTLTLCRPLFLLARLGDSLLLTHLPQVLKRYIPCWCQINSTLFLGTPPVQRPSRQILMNHTDSSNNEPNSAGEMTSSNDSPMIREQNYRHQQFVTRRHQRFRRRFRLRIQFVAPWSAKRPRLLTQSS